MIRERLTNPDGSSTIAYTAESLAEAQAMHERAAALPPPDLAEAYRAALRRAARRAAYRAGLAAKATP